MAKNYKMMSREQLLTKHAFAKEFVELSDGEGVYTTGSNLTYISIQSRGNIYTKDINPLYVQNINNVNRSNTQTESFKLILQV